MNPRGAGRSRSLLVGIVVMSLVLLIPTSVAASSLNHNRVNPACGDVPRRNQPVRTWGPDPAGNPIPGPSGTPEIERVAGSHEATKACTSPTASNLPLTLRMQHAAGMIMEDSGSILVADRGCHVVWRIKNTGSGTYTADIAAGQLGSPGNDDHTTDATLGTLTNPHTLTVTAGGDVLIGEFGSGTIRRLNTKSSSLSVYATGFGNSIAALAADDKGGVYGRHDTTGLYYKANVATNPESIETAATAIADIFVNGSDVFYSTVGGNGLFRFDGSTSTEYISGLLIGAATGIAIDGAGRLVYCDNGALKIAMSTTVQTTIATSIALGGGCHSLVVARDGTILVTVGHQSVARVRSTHVTPFPTDAPCLALNLRHGVIGDMQAELDPRPVQCTLADGFVPLPLNAEPAAAWDPLAPKVLPGDPAEGTLHVLAGRTDSQYANAGNPVKAGFNGPTGIVFEHAGRLLIADTENSVVRVVDRVSRGASYVAGDAETGGTPTAGSNPFHARLSSPRHITVLGATDAIAISSGATSVAIARLDSGQVTTVDSGEHISICSDRFGRLHALQAPLGVGLDGYVGATDPLGMGAAVGIMGSVFPDAKSIAVGHDNYMYAARLSGVVVRLDLTAAGFGNTASVVGTFATTLSTAFATHLAFDGTGALVGSVATDGTRSTVILERLSGPTFRGPPMPSASNNAQTIAPLASGTGFFAIDRDGVVFFTSSDSRVHMLKHRLVHPFPRLTRCETYTVSISLSRTPVATPTVSLTATLSLSSPPTGSSTVSATPSVSVSPSLSVSISPRPSSSATASSAATTSISSSRVSTPSMPASRSTTPAAIVTMTLTAPPTASATASNPPTPTRTRSLPHTATATLVPPPSGTTSATLSRSPIPTLTLSVTPSVSTSRSASRATASASRSLSVQTLSLSPSRTATFTASAGPTLTASGTPSTTLSLSVSAASGTRSGPTATLSDTPSVSHATPSSSLSASRPSLSSSASRRSVTPSATPASVVGLLVAAPVVHDLSRLLKRDQEWREMLQQNGVTVAPPPTPIAAAPMMMAAPPAGPTTAAPTATPAAVAQANGPLEIVLDVGLGYRTRASPDVSPPTSELTSFWSQIGFASSDLPPPFSCLRIRRRASNSSTAGSTADRVAGDLLERHATVKLVNTTRFVLQLWPHLLPANTSKSALANSIIDIHAETGCFDPSLVRGSTTVRFSAEEPARPKPALQAVTEATETGVATVTVVSTLTGSPGGAIAAQRIGTLTAECSDSDDDTGAFAHDGAVAFDVSPSQASVGTDRERYYTGAALVNPFLCLSLIALHMICAVVFAKALKKTLRQAMLMVRVPSGGLVVTLVASQPTAQAALIAVSGGGGVAIAVVIFVTLLFFVASAVGAWYILRTNFRATYVPNEKPDDSVTTKTKMPQQQHERRPSNEEDLLGGGTNGAIRRDAATKPSLKARVWAAVLPEGEWMIGQLSVEDMCDTHAPAESYRTVLATPMYVDYNSRGKYFMLVELAMSTLAGVSIAVDSVGGCMAGSVTLLVVLLLYCVAVFTIRPHCLAFDRWLAYFMSVGQLIAAVLRLVYVVRDEPVRGQVAVDAFVFLLQLAAILRGAFDFFNFVRKLRVFCGGERKRRAEAIAAATHVGFGNFTEEERQALEVEVHADKLSTTAEATGGEEHGSGEHDVEAMLGIRRRIAPTQQLDAAASDAPPPPPRPAEDPPTVTSQEERGRLAEAQRDDLLDTLLENDAGNANNGTGDTRARSRSALDRAVMRASRRERRRARRLLDALERGETYSSEGDDSSDLSTSADSDEDLLLAGPCAGPTAGAAGMLLNSQTHGRAGRRGRARRLRHDSTVSASGNGPPGIPMPGAARGAEVAATRVAATLAAVGGTQRQWHEDLEESAAPTPALGSELVGSPTHPGTGGADPFPSSPQRRAAGTAADALDVDVDDDMDDLL